MRLLDTIIRHAVRRYVPVVAVVAVATSHVACCSDESKPPTGAGNNPTTFKAGEGCAHMASTPDGKRAAVWMSRDSEGNQVIKYAQAEGVLPSLSDGKEVVNAKALRGALGLCGVSRAITIGEKGANFCWRNFDGSVTCNSSNTDGNVDPANALPFNDGVTDIGNLALSAMQDGNYLAVWNNGSGIVAAPVAHSNYLNASSPVVLMNGSQPSVDVNPNAIFANQGINVTATKPGGGIQMVVMSSPQAEDGYLLNPGPVHDVQSDDPSIAELNTSSTVTVTRQGVAMVASNTQGGFLNIKFVDQNGLQLSSGTLDSSFVKFRPRGGAFIDTGPAMLFGERLDGAVMMFAIDDFWNNPTGEPTTLVDAGGGATFVSTACSQFNCAVALSTQDADRYSAVEFREAGPLGTTAVLLDAPTIGLPSGEVSCGDVSIESGASPSHTSVNLVNKGGQVLEITIKVPTNYPFQPAGSVVTSAGTDPNDPNVNVYTIQIQPFSGVNSDPKVPGFEIIFTPTSVGDSAGQFTLNSNDPANPQAVLTMRGHGHSG